MRRDLEGCIGIRNSMENGKGDYKVTSLSYRGLYALPCIGFNVKLHLIRMLRAFASPGCCPHPVTVYIRGPIKGYTYPYYNIIQLLLRGGSTKVWQL